MPPEAPVRAIFMTLASRAPKARAIRSHADGPKTPFYRDAYFFLPALDTEGDIPAVANTFGFSFLGFLASLFFFN